VILRDGESSFFRKSNQIKPKPKAQCQQCTKYANVKSKDVVHECETEFGVLPVSDVIDIRKKNFS